MREDSNELDRELGMDDEEEENNDINLDGDDEENLPDDAEDPEEIRDQDPDFDDDDLLEDGEMVNNREVNEMNDQIVEQIEQEAEMNRRAREYMEKIEGKRTKRGDISTNILIVNIDSIYNFNKG